MAQFCLTMQNRGLKHHLFKYDTVFLGGKIDRGHHENIPQKAMDETAAFDDAVAKALELTSEEDTLILVTADHSHVFTFAGYGANNHDILGKQN